MLEAAAQLIEPDLRLFPVRTAALDARVLATDLYVRATPADAPTVLHYAGDEFTENDRRHLLEAGTQFLYIPVEQHTAYRRALLERLDRLFHERSGIRAERVHTVRATCARVIEDVLVFACRPESIDAVADLAAQLAHWLSTDPEEFAHLLDMSAHDYYTVAHLLNVGIGCGLLGAELDLSGQARQAELIQGGLLHDVGKRGVPEDILHKPGPLSVNEWSQVRAHPLSGYEELSRSGGVPRTVLEMVRDHHERLDGQGYPNGLSGRTVGQPARICAVVDVFDAICSARPYCGSTSAAEALRIMQEGGGTQFDRDVLEAWTRLVHRLIQRDPERMNAPAPAPNSATTARLADFIPSPPVRTGFLRKWFRDVTDPRDRRRHERFPCNKGIRVRFLRLGKPCEVNPCEWVGLQISNISSGGLEIRTPWPLTINDVLEVELALRNAQRTIRRLGYVVGVRTGKAGQWLAGVSFAYDS